jgi:hypothetical protein
MYRLSVSNLRVEEYDFATAETAAWACDKARLALSPYLKRNRAYNFPERIEAMSESEVGVVSPAVLAALTSLGITSHNLQAAPPPTPPPELTIKQQLIAALYKQNELAAMRCDLGTSISSLRTVLRHLESNYPDTARKREYKRLVKRLEEDAKIMTFAMYKLTDDVRDLREAGGEKE